MMHIFNERRFQKTKMIIAKYCYMNAIIILLIDYAKHVDYIHSYLLALFHNVFLSLILLCHLSILYCLWFIQINCHHFFFFCFYPIQLAKNVTENQIVRIDEPNSN